MSPISSPDQQAKITPRRNFSGCSARSFASDAASSITQADARSIVVRAGMNLVFFAGALERTAAAVAEMIVMRADQNVFVTLPRRRRQVRDDICVVLLQMLDAAGELHFHLRQNERRLRVRVFLVERRLEFFQRFSARREERVGASCR